MNLCETCKHWSRHQRLPENEWHATEYAEQGIVFEDHGTCGMAENDYPDMSRTIRPRETLAWAEDGENYVAGLTTHKTFGCVQWAAKE